MEHTVQKDKLPELPAAVKFIKGIYEMPTEEWDALSNHDHDELAELLSICEAVVKSWKRNTNAGHNGFIVRQ